MTDQQIRAAVRDVLARRLGRGPASVRAADAPPVAVDRGPAAVALHPSHAIYVTLVNSGEACVIEPGVACSHCHYCKSHGY